MFPLGCKFGHTLVLSGDDYENIVTDSFCGNYSYVIRTCTTDTIETIDPPPGN